MPTYIPHSLIMTKSGNSVLKNSDMYKVIVENEKFPDNLGEYENLEIIEFNNFPIKYLPAALIELSTFPNITDCKIFYYGDQKDLYDIPEEIGNCTSLKYLFTKGMLNIPQSLGNCKELVLVNIDSSQPFREFPSVFNELPNLEQVDIDVIESEQYFRPEWVRDTIARTSKCCPESMFYTHHGNVILNSQMRQGHIPNFLKPVYLAMINGQVYTENSLKSNEILHLYRGIHPEYVENLQIGDIIYDNGFSSFTSRFKIAVGFTDRANPYIIELAYKGKALFLGNSALSHYPHEEEFVLGPQTSLQITNIEKIFIEQSQSEWSPAKKITVTIIDIDPLQSLEFSNDLENELLNLFSRYEFLSNTETSFIYNTDKLKRKLLQRNLGRKTYKKQYSLALFLIEYITGNIEGLNIDENY